MAKSINVDEEHDSAPYHTVQPVEVIVIDVCDDEDDYEDSDSSTVTDEASPESPQQVQTDASPPHVNNDTILTNNEAGAISPVEQSSQKRKLRRKQESLQKAEFTGLEDPMQLPLVRCTAEVKALRAHPLTQFEKEMNDEQIDLPELLQLENMWGEVAEDEPVFARWVDGNYYSGIIYEKGHHYDYFVNFDDGMRSPVAARHILPIKILGVGLQGIYSVDHQYRPQTAHIVGQKMSIDLEEVALAVKYAIFITGNDAPIWCTRRQLVLSKEVVESLWDVSTVKSFNNIVTVNAVTVEGPSFSGKDNNDGNDNNDSSNGKDRSLKRKLSGDGVKTGKEGADDDPDKKKRRKRKSKPVGMPPKRRDLIDWEAYLRKQENKINKRRQKKSNVEAEPSQERGLSEEKVQNDGEMVELNVENSLDGVPNNPEIELDPELPIVQNERERAEVEMIVDINNSEDDDQKENKGHRRKRKRDDQVKWVGKKPKYEANCIKSKPDGEAKPKNRKRDGKPKKTKKQSLSTHVNTCVASSNLNHDSDIEIISTNPEKSLGQQAGNEDKKLFDGLQFIVMHPKRKINYNKIAIIEYIQRNGGEVVQKIREKQIPNQLFLVADCHRRTIKYLHSVASAKVACVSYKWIWACVLNGQLKDYRDYVLPPGYSYTHKFVIPWHIRRPLENCKILVSPEPLFSKYKEVIYSAGGLPIRCTKKAIENGHGMPEGTTMVLLRRNSVYEEELRYLAKTRNIHVKEEFWIQEFIITGEKVLEEKERCIVYGGHNEDGGTETSNNDHEHVVTVNLTERESSEMSQLG